MLIGSCQRCGAPASLRCAFCARTVCRNCLDADERMCPDCVHLQKKQAKHHGVASSPPPPSHRMR